jgi:hypothetical protein
MQAIRSELKESGVIGEVVNDFLPHMQLYVQFGNKRISLGEYLSPANVQRQPDSIEIEHENLSLMNALENSRFVLVCNFHLYLVNSYFVFYYIKLKIHTKIFLINPNDQAMTEPHTCCESLHWYAVTLLTSYRISQCNSTGILLL